jgi:O-antigen/teichoic acid export membrane protein
MLLQQAGIFILASILLGFITLLINQSTNLPINQIPISIYIFSVFVISIIAFFLWKKQLTIPSINQYTTQQISQSTKTLPYSTILSVSIPMLFSSSLALIMGWTDTIMLGMFRTEEEVGIYNVALRLSMITSITLMAINTIAAPKFSEFYSKGDMEGLKNIVQSSTKMIFFTSMPVIAILILFPKQILGMFGEEFTVGYLALWILMAGQIVNSMTGSVGYILIMTGKEKLFQNIIVITSILNIVLNYIFVRKYGLTGVAMSTAISLSLLNIISFLYIRHEYGFYTLNLKTLWRFE